MGSFLGLRFKDASDTCELNPNQPASPNNLRHKGANKAKAASESVPPAASHNSLPCLCHGMIPYKQKHPQLAFLCRNHPTLGSQVHSQPSLHSRHEHYRGRRVGAQHLLQGQIRSCGKTRWQNASLGSTNRNTETDNRTRKPPGHS